MTARKKSPASTRLAKVILPGKEAIGKIVAEIHCSVNSTEASDLVLQPFYEIMDNIKRSMQ